MKSKDIDSLYVAHNESIKLCKFLKTLNIQNTDKLKADKSIEKIRLILKKLADKDFDLEKEYEEKALKYANLFENWQKIIDGYKEQAEEYKSALESIVRQAGGVGYMVGKRAEFLTPLAKIVIADCETKK